MDFGNNEKVNNLVEKLKAKADSKGLCVSEDDAFDEIQNALLEYYNDRHYTPTEDKPYEDIYAGIIIQLAISAISKNGAEGETSHSEGGVSRSYDNASSYPLSLTRKIIPLAKGVDIQ
jgi:hypothetical protein